MAITPSSVALSCRLKATSINLIYNNTVVRQWTSTNYSDYVTIGPTVEGAYYNVPSKTYTFSQNPRTVTGTTYAYDKNTLSWQWNKYVTSKYYANDGSLGYQVTNSQYYQYWYTVPTSWNSTTKYQTKTIGEITVPVGGNYTATAQYTTLIAEATSKGTDYTFTTTTPSADAAGTKTGYTFAKWKCNTSPYSGNLYDANLEHTWSQALSSTYEFEPTWTANTYTIKYNANGGSGSMSNTSATYDSNATLTANAFTKTGYHFKNWNTKSNGSGTSYNNGATVSNLATSGSVTLYAQWEANTYSITYNYDGGTQGTNHPSSGTFDSTVTISNPSKAGYGFTGWTLTTGDTSTAMYGDSASTVTTAWTSGAISKTYFKNLQSTNGGTAKLTANWENGVYTITFNLEGGTFDGNGNWGTSANKSNVTATHRVTYNANYYYSTGKANKTGCTFDGWWTKNSNGAYQYQIYNSSGACTTDGGYWTGTGTSARWTGTSSINVYAKWVPNTYYVKFNGNGSTTGSMSNQTFAYGTPQNLTANAFTKKDYAFKCWNTVAGGTGTNYLNGQSVNNLTTTAGGTVNLYAQWVPASKVLVSGAWKTVKGARVLVNGSWKMVSGIKVLVSGVWKDFTGFGT